MASKPSHGGSRKGAGRPPKGEEKREQKSVSLTPRVWAFIAMIQLARGGSESDALERICRTHLFFVPEEDV